MDLRPLVGLLLATLTIAWDILLDSEVMEAVAAELGRKLSVTSCLDLGRTWTWSCLDLGQFLIHNNWSGRIRHRQQDPFQIRACEKEATLFELNETAVFIRPLHGILQNCNPSCERPFTITLIPRTDLVMVVADMTCPCTTTSEYERDCRTKAMYRTEPQGRSAS